MSSAYQFQKVGFNECVTFAFRKQCDMNRFTSLLAITGESAVDIGAPLVCRTIASRWILCNDGLILQVFWSIIGFSENLHCFLKWMC